MNESKQKILLNIGKHALLYLVAISFGKFMQHISEDNAPIFNNLLSLFIIISLVYIIIAILDYSSSKKEEKIMKDKREEDNYRRISVKYEENHASLDNAYDISALAVSKAESRIMIVADYSPYFEKLAIPPSRQKYYRAIERVLIDKIEEERKLIQQAQKSTKKSDISIPKFKYIRFMQRDKLNFESIPESSKGDRGYLIESHKMIEGDEQAFAHCKRVFDIIERNGNVSFELYLTQFIPSLPSILVVDNHNLLFTIPKRTIGPIIKTAGVIDFTDNTKSGSAIVQNFISIINSLTDDPREYAKVTNIKNGLENQNKEYNMYLKMP